LVNALLRGHEVIKGAKGRWRFGLKAVYTIGILDFVFDENKDDEDYFHHEVKLMDVNKKEVFYDKLTYIYLEMPKFRKTEAELKSLFDKWLYALKNLSRLLERPAILQERIFRMFFNVASQRRTMQSTLRAKRSTTTLTGPSDLP